VAEVPAQPDDLPQQLGPPVKQADLLTTQIVVPVEETHGLFCRACPPLEQFLHTFY
jgi:hypothetical protein